MLATVIAALKGNSELEDAAVLAVELIRLGVLNADSMFPTYNGAPMRGESELSVIELLSSIILIFGQAKIATSICSYLELLA